MAKKRRPDWAKRLIEDNNRTPSPRPLGSWVRLPTCVAEDQKLSDRDKMVYADLVLMAGGLKPNVFKMSMASLAKKQNRHYRVLLRALDSLEARGLIYRESIEYRDCTTIVFRPLQEVYGERADMVVDRDPASPNMLKVNGREDQDECMDEKVTPDVTKKSTRVTADVTKKCVRCDEKVMSDALKSTSDVTKKCFVQEDDETDASVDDSVDEKNPPAGGGRSSSTNTTTETDDEAVAERGAPVSRPVEPTTLSSFVETPKHPKSTARDRRGPPGLFGGPPAPPPVAPVKVKPVPPQTGYDVFAYLKTEIRKRWPEAHLPVKLNKGEERTLQTKIVDCYERTTVVEMIRVLVWDWEALRVSVWPESPDQKVPTIKKLIEYKDTLVSAAGTGYTHGSTFRVSKYYERYCVEGGETDTTPKPGRAYKRGYSYDEVQEMRRKKREEEEKRRKDGEANG